MQVPLAHKSELHCELPEQGAPSGKVPSQRPPAQVFDKHCELVEQVEPLGNAV